MKVEVEQTRAEDFPGRFPLYVRVTFTGSDREALVRLADVWARTFVEQNAELFMARTAQSLDYVSQTFTEVERELYEKQNRLEIFLKENPEPVIQAEVSALQAKYSGYLQSLMETEKQLAGVEARVNALREALAQEPQVFVVHRAPSDEAFWQFLGTRPDAKALADYAELTLADQILNSTYVSLRGQLASAQAELASLRASVAYYQEALTRIAAEFAARQAKLTEVQMRRQQLEQEISVLRDTYILLAKSLQEAKVARAETIEPIRIVERPVFPTIPVGSSRKLNVAVAGVLGLFLGVLLAFFVHWLQASPGQPTEEKEKP